MAITRFAETEPYDIASGEILNKMICKLVVQANNNLTSGTFEINQTYEGIDL